MDLDPTTAPVGVETRPGAPGPWQRHSEALRSWVGWPGPSLSRSERSLSLLGVLGITLGLAQAGQASAAEPRPGTPLFPHRSHGLLRHPDCGLHPRAPLGTRLQPGPLLVPRANGLARLGRKLSAVPGSRCHSSSMGTTAPVRTVGKQRPSPSPGLGPAVLLKEQSVHGACAVLPRRSSAHTARLHAQGCRQHDSPATVRKGRTGSHRVEGTHRQPPCGRDTGAGSSPVLHLLSC